VKRTRSRDGGEENGKEGQRQNGAFYCTSFFFVVAQKVL
jgi:hypothetical protein